MMTPMEFKRKWEISWNLMAEILGYETTSRIKHDNESYKKQISPKITLDLMRCDRLLTLQQCQPGDRDTILFLLM